MKNHLINATLFSITLTVINLCFAVDDIDMSEWLKYTDNLQTCTPGTFNLPDPVLSAMSQKILYENYKINGMKDNLCEIMISRQVPGSNPPIMLTINCSFTSEQLKIVVEGAKEIARNKKISPDDPISKVMDAACKEAKP